MKEIAWNSLLVKVAWGVFQRCVQTTLDKRERRTSSNHLGQIDPYCTNLPTLKAPDGRWDSQDFQVWSRGTQHTVRSTNYNGCITWIFPEIRRFPSKKPTFLGAQYSCWRRWKIWKEPSIIRCELLVLVREGIEARHLGHVHFPAMFSVAIHKIP